MAGRSIQELLGTACVFDIRPFTGSIQDRTGNMPPNWTLTDPPTIRRSIGQVVGLDFIPPSALRFTGVIPPPANFVIEFTAMLRSVGVGGGRIIRAGAPIMDSSPGLGKLSFWAGAGLLTNANVYTFGIPFHAAISVSGTTGTWYENGSVGTSGAVGVLKPTFVTLGNSAPGDVNGMDGMIYQCRIFDTAIDPDEAIQLYEASRVKLLPGAPRRSGIVSAI